MPDKITVIVSALLLLISCNGNKQAVPRPHGFPRIELCDTSKSATIETENLKFRINGHWDGNEQTEKRESGTHRWFNIALPAYGATLYITGSNAKDESSLTGIIENRIERGELNLSGASANLSEYTNENGWKIRTLTTTAAHQTPVQFIAVSPAPEKMVVSGTVAFDNPVSAAQTDSLMPYIQGIYVSIEQLLHTLSINEKICR